MPAVAVLAPSAPIGDAVVVLGAHSGAEGPALTAPGADLIERPLREHLAQAYRDAGGSGAVDEVIKIPTLGLVRYPLVAVTGLGARPAADVVPAVAADRVRCAVAAAVRALAAHPRLRICVAESTLDSEALASAAVFGAALGGYRFGRYQSRTRAVATQRIGVCVDGPSRATSAAARRALVLCDAVMWVRDLVNMPPNDLYPESFADAVTSAAADTGVEVEVLTERQLARRGFGGLLAIGRGSVHGPRLLRLHYRAPRARASVALVGEGTTFNSGGLNLKTAQMSWTKADMSGAAAVAAVVLAAARRKLGISVTATIPLAENLPSGGSYRPSDILTLHGGRTVEVTDTGASGRVIVAEAITQAASDHPDFLLEASTLTAAQRVALGPQLIAVMGEPALRDLVVTAGTAQGEASWAMPLTPELRAGLNSSAADLSTVAGERWGAMLSAGAFLADFVPSGLAWAHLDIAGPAWNTGRAHGYTPKGGTGAGVVTLLATLEAIATDA